MSTKCLLRAILTEAFLLFFAAAIGAETDAIPDFAYRVGSGAVLLRGPWERFDGPTTDGLPEGKATRIVDFPLRQRSPGADSSAGPAAYRIGIRLQGDWAGGRLALHIPAFSGIEAVYADGLRLYDAGRDPAAPPLLLFDAVGAKVSLVLKIPASAPGLEAASFFPSFVVFGAPDSVSREKALFGLAAAIQDGFLIIAGLFVFVLFMFWKKNRDFLAYSIFLIVVGACYFFKDGALFFYLPLGAVRGYAEAASLVAIDLQYLALTFFIRTLYGDRLRAALALPLYAIPAALAVGAMTLPSLLGADYIGSEAYCSLFGLAALFFFVRLAAKGDRKARWLIPAFVPALAALGLRRFGPESIWNAYLMEPTAVAIFGIVVMLMLVKKVADTFESAGALTEYVDSVTRTVKSFIPTEFLEHLNKTDVIDLRLGDHAKKEMTIFFSDIRAFTELSEGLTVEENFAFINSYLARVVPIIKENGGFVDKYMGDAIMALFPGPRGPDEAIRSAIAMQSRMVEYNGHRASVGYRPISMGVGIHTGDLMLGVVGVTDRMENTVISDAVNLCSRLQAITKAFNIALAISEQAFKELEDPGFYKYRFIGRVKVKGKAAPVSVFEIFDGIAPELFERKMKANTFFEQGMLSYYQKDFAGAMYYFKRVLETIPEDGAAGFYLDNCMTKATP
jgi:two-component system sensor histidine kinase ChiS